jgi:hypothetical protein
MEYNFMKMGWRRCVMANLQIKNIDNSLYAQIKDLAAAENRSISQQVLFLVKSYLNQRKHTRATKTPAQVLLELSGSWEDDKSSEEIISEIKRARRNSDKLKNGF